MGVTGKVTQTLAWILQTVALENPYFLKMTLQQNWKNNVIFRWQSLNHENSPVVN